MLKVTIVTTDSFIIQVGPLLRFLFEKKEIEIKTSIVLYANKTFLIERFRARLAEEIEIDDRHWGYSRQFSCQNLWNISTTSPDGFVKPILSTTKFPEMILHSCLSLFLQIQFYISIFSKKVNEFVLYIFNSMCLHVSNFHGQSPDLVKHLHSGI